MKELSVLDKILAFCAAQEFPIPEVAKVTNLTEEVVSLKLSDRLIKEEADGLRHKLFSEDTKKRVQELLPRAIDIWEKALKDPSAKLQAQIAVAQEIADRAMGKPKQVVEHEGSLLRALFEKMDATKDVMPIIEGEVALDVSAGVPTPALPPAATSDPVDKWVSENL